ncbi:hypothetical protein KAW65_04030 [candidate division WOR-3 bacterium]|nr:hypothetical protein [candidate division WOR-3 bacterium]
MKKLFLFLFVLLSLALSGGCQKRHIKLEITKWEINHPEGEHPEESEVKIHYKLVNKSTLTATKIKYEFIVKTEHSHPYPRYRRKIHKVMRREAEKSLLQPGEEYESVSIIEVPWSRKVLTVSGRVLAVDFKK